MLRLIIRFIILLDDTSKEEIEECKKTIKKVVVSLVFLRDWQLSL